MPELPEVEITRRALTRGLSGERVTTAVVRTAQLRYPLPDDLAGLLAGRKLDSIDRRGKYLLLRFEHGTLIAHLGMSGSLRLVPPQLAPAKHDHVDIVFGQRAMRLHDPRRFGALLWAGAEADRHSLLAALGVEPLSREFTPEWLHRATRGRKAAIKLVLMDSRTVVGVGNIYASESLFRARIHPLTPAQRLSRARCTQLVPAVRQTLQAALRAGGSTLRDFVHSDGSLGCFQNEYYVYGRAAEACRICGRAIRQMRHAQRSTFYCPGCQRY